MGKIAKIAIPVAALAAGGYLAAPLFAGAAGAAAAGAGATTAVTAVPAWMATAGTAAAGSAYAAGGAAAAGAGLSLSQILTLTGGAVNAYGQYQQGQAQGEFYRQQKLASDREALVLDQIAGQKRAEAIQASNEQRRQFRLAQSRAVAVAGASGTSPGDTGTVKIISDLAGEGEYRALTALYAGDIAAQNYEQQATLRRYDALQYGAAGRLARDRSYAMAATTIAGAGIESSLLRKYG